MKLNFTIRYSLLINGRSFQGEFVQDLNLAFSVPDPSNELIAETVRNALRTNKEHFRNIAITRIYASVDKKTQQDIEKYLRENPQHAGYMQLSFQNLRRY